MEQLKAVNTALKNRGVKVRLVVVRDRLFVRGTFTDSTGEREERKINLDVPAAPLTPSTSPFHRDPQRAEGAAATQITQSRF